MRALSLWQPWASLNAVGGKEYETRSWWPPRSVLPSVIAIHAAKREHPEFRRHPEVVSLLGNDPLPKGAVVAVALLQRARRTEQVLPRIAPQEEHLGNYSPQRVAWRLTRVWRVPDPIPMRGNQGLWTIPDAPSWADALHIMERTLGTTLRARNARFMSTRLFDTPRLCPWLESPAATPSSATPDLVFSEVASGRNLQRPGEQEVMDRVQDEDNIVVAFLYRLSRNPWDGLHPAQHRHRGHPENIDTQVGSTAAIFFRQSMLAQGPYQVDSASERFRLALERACAGGKRVGRPTALGQGQAEQRRRMAG